MIPKLRALLVAVASAAAFALLPSAPADAADAQGYYKTVGIGQKTCGEFLDAHRSKGDDYRQFQDWFEGYISAYNRWTPGVSSVAGSTPMATHNAWLVEFCTGSSSSFFSKAVDRLVRDLGPK